MLSIIIPVYNGEKYISRCLESLLPAASEQIEVIAVNDGSRDGSSEILHAYAEKYSRLCVIDKENGGAASARRCGLAQAAGEYVAFLDIDDFAEPELYTALLEKAQSTDADIVFCDYTEEKGDKQKKIKNKFFEGESFPINGERAMEYLHRREAVFPFPWNKIYKVGLFENTEFPEGNFVGEDYHMLLRLLPICERVEYLPVCGYHYVLTENSASRRGYDEATVKTYEHFMNNYTYICENHEKMQKNAANYVITEYMACIISMERNSTYNKEMIREIKAFVRKNLSGYLGASYVSLTMKASAIALCISYRALILGYRLLNM